MHTRAIGGDHAAVGKPIPRQTRAVVVSEPQATRRITIRDVARHAGVSIKTVSRVVNREANVRPETRARVEDAIRDLDFEPNPAARGLAGRRTFSIGLLYEIPHEFSYIQQLLEGVFAVCETHGYTLLLRPVNESPDAADIVRFIAQTRVDGVVLTAPIGDRREVTDALSARRTPFVQISPGITDARWTSVGPDDFAGSRVLTEHLLGLGHERIAFIKGDPRHGATEQRLNGHTQSLSRPGADRSRPIRFRIGEERSPSPVRASRAPDRHHRQQ